jgi:hypothetical protein
MYRIISLERYLCKPGSPLCDSARTIVARELGGTGLRGSLRVADRGT